MPPPPITDTDSSTVSLIHLYLYINLILFHLNLGLIGRGVGKPPNCNHSLSEHQVVWGVVTIIIQHFVSDLSRNEYCGVDKHIAGFDVFVGFVCPSGPFIDCISFSASRVNPSSHSAGSFTSPLRPQIKGNRLLLLLQTCASRPPSPTQLSPRPKRATLRVEGTLIAGATLAWAAPPRPRVARPATPSPDRSSPAGTCLRCSGPRALSSPPSSWASNQGRTAPPSLEPHAPESPTSMTWRRLRCNLLPSNSTSKNVSILQTQTPWSYRKGLHKSLVHWIKSPYMSLNSTKT